MRSYASVDRIEGEYTVLEVELLDTETSRTTSFKDKETIMVDVLTETIKNVIEEFEEGDIIVLEHEDEIINTFYEKDDNEKQRRIDILKAIMEQVNE